MGRRPSLPKVGRRQSRSYDEERFSPRPASRLGGRQVINSCPPPTAEAEFRCHVLTSMAISPAVRIAGRSRSIPGGLCDESEFGLAGVSPETALIKRRWSIGPMALRRRAKSRRLTTLAPASAAKGNRRVLAPSHLQRTRATGTSGMLLPQRCDSRSRAPPRSSSARVLRATASVITSVGAGSAAMSAIPSRVESRGVTDLPSGRSSSSRYGALFSGWSSTHTMRSIGRIGTSAVSAPQGAAPHSVDGRRDYVIVGAAQHPFKLRGAGPTPDRVALRLVLDCLEFLLDSLETSRRRTPLGANLRAS